MKKRQFMGLFVTAAFLAGATEVHAIMLVDQAGSDPEDASASMASVTYAKETLLKTVTVKDSDGNTYYTIARDHYVSGPSDIAANVGDIYTVTYTLDGMVFAAAPSLKKYVVTGSGMTRMVAGAGDDSFGSTPFSGGTAGDSSVVFRLETSGTASPQMTCSR